MYISLRPEISKASNEKRRKKIQHRAESPMLYHGLKICSINYLRYICGFSFENIVGIA